MTIRSTTHSNPEVARLLRKADQHWDMAGLARQDHDKADEERHTLKAREYTAQAGELARALR